MNTNIKPTIAVFDFDNTITTKDSLLEFLLWDHPKKILFVLKMLKFSMYLFLYELRLIDNHYAKEKLFNNFYKGEKESEFNDRCKKFAIQNLNRIINPDAIKKINWHKDNNHQVVIISSSIENYIQPWAEINGINKVLGTILTIKDSKLTGKFTGRICYGQEKLNRFKAEYGDPSQYYVYAYGDSKGDKEILQIADQKFYRKF